MTGTRVKFVDGLFVMMGRYVLNTVDNANVPFVAISGDARGWKAVTTSMSACLPPPATVDGGAGREEL